MKNLINMVILWAGTFTAGGASAAVQIQTFAPANNDRFANDPAFQANAYDWSGVGRAANGSWVTMVSPNVFLGALHYNPGVGNTVTFFPNNDPSATPVTATISAAQPIGSTDLWIGTFAAPLPSAIATYSFVDEAITTLTYSASSLASEFSYMSGVSPTSSGYGASPLTNQAVGTNRIEGFLAGQIVGSAIGDALTLVDNRPGDIGYTLTTYETALKTGDSGSPLMVVAGGELSVAGIAWANGSTTVNGLTQRDASIYSYTGSSAAVIQAYIDAHAVPEPSATALSLGLLTQAFRRRRVSA